MNYRAFIKDGISSSRELSVAAVFFDVFKRLPTTYELRYWCLRASDHKDLRDVLYSSLCATEKSVRDSRFSISDFNKVIDVDWEEVKRNDLSSYYKFCVIELYRILLHRDPQENDLKACVSSIKSSGNVFVIFNSLSHCSEHRNLKSFGYDFNAIAECHRTLDKLSKLEISQQVKICYAYLVLFRLLKKEAKLDDAKTTIELCGNHHDLGVFFVAIYYALAAEISASDFDIHQYSKPQIFVDISEIIVRDARTGIQRVTRNVLREWLRCNISTHSIRPVYAKSNRVYYYANEYLESEFGISHGADHPCLFFKGDIFFGLDFQPRTIPKQSHFFARLRAKGVRIGFLIHDILPITLPQYFNKSFSDVIPNWLRFVSSNSDFIIHDSKATAQSVRDWISENIVADRTPVLHWAHIAADILTDATASHVGDNIAPDMLKKILNNKYFLMVGTLEPRKGHTPIIEAFSILWESGFDGALVIVGKKGWQCDDLVNLITSHPEYNKKLFWLSGISDLALIDIYKGASCLIAASYGEGFGLNIIEAASFGIPVLARDIPVFREVAQNYAEYFDSDCKKEIASKLTDFWSTGRSRNCTADGYSVLTWRESATWMLELCVNS